MLIVDTYNVLHAAPRVDPGFAGLTLPALVRLLEVSRFQTGTLLICDGTGSRTGLDDGYAHPDAPIRVVFAGPGKDADSAIARLVIEEERKGRAGAVTVVSSDKGVLASAIGPFGAKARRMTSEQFVRAILDDVNRAGRPSDTLIEPERPTLDADGTRRWMREFGIEGSGGVVLGEGGSGGSGSENRTTQENQSSGSESRTTQEWPEGIDPDDLDMRKWLKE